MKGTLSLKEENIMKEKLLKALDPNNEYTYEEFIEEYNGNITANNFDFHKLDFKFVNKSTNEDPKYQTDGSSGFDLRANLDKPITLKAGEYRMIPTGLYFEIPPNFEIQVRPRSGLATKYGITVLNSPGTIDSDYRGEIKIILINHGKEDFVIQHGERIAQAVITTVTAKNIINLRKVNSIDDNTERGTGGFGSTGRH